MPQITLSKSQVAFLLDLLDWVETMGTDLDYYRALSPEEQGQYPARMEVLMQTLKEALPGWPREGWG